MVLIQVKCECGECCREWALLDLQGEISLPQSESVSGMTLGSFCKDGPVSHRSALVADPAQDFFITNPLLLDT